MSAINIHDPETGNLLATIIPAYPNHHEKCKTEFVTDRKYSIQVGVLHRSGGTTIEAHQHLPAQKTVMGTQEVLIVQSGNIQVDIYNAKKEYICSYTIKTRDIYVQYCGGHAFHFLTDAQFVEIKQGPYTPADKVYFNPLSHEQTK
jgi:hypothetical protein